MKKYLFYSSICIVVGVLPSLHIFPSLDIYDEKRLFQVILLVWVGVFFIVKQSPPYFNRSTKWGIALFFIMGLISLWINNDWYHGLQELSMYVLLLSFFFYIVGVYRQHSMQFAKGMVLMLLLLGSLYVLKFFIGYSMHILGNYPLWPGAPYEYHFFGFAHIRFFNQIQVWTLPLFLIWIDRGNPSKFLKSHSIISYLFFFLASFWWCLVLQSAGRGATLSLLIAPLVVLVLFNKKSHSYIKTYLTSFGVGIVLKYLLFDVFSSGGVSLSLARAGEGASTRLFIWPKIITAIIKHPFLGYGPMSVANINSVIKFGHPHNSVLQIAYEFGVPAMLIILGLILFGLYRWFDQCRTVQDNNNLNLRSGVSVALLAGLGYSLFSGVIVMPLSQLWLALIGGWAVGIYAGQSRWITKDLAGFGKLTGLALKTIVLAALLFMSYSMITEVPRLKENQHRYIMKYGGKFHPRFWQQGRLRQGYGD